MADDITIEPGTPEERQAVATVWAARDVYNEIEQLSTVVKDSARPVDDRVEAKHALVSASERLCNLMSLAEYQVESNTAKALQEQLRGTLHALRDRLMALSGRLMVEKLEQLDRRAEKVLQENDYPVGLAGKLDQSFANLMSHLKALGGPEKLGEAVPTLVEKTKTDIKNLAQIEELTGIMKDVQPDKPKG